MSHKIYSDTESTIYFLPSSAASGSDCVAFDCTGLPNGSGMRSDVRDLGAFPRSSQYRWRGKFNATSPNTNTGVDVFWSSFDATSDIGSSVGRDFNTDLGLPSGQGSMSDTLGRASNLEWIGSISTGSGFNGPFTRSGLTQIFGRYGQVVFYNGTGVALGSGTQIGFALTPVPDELQ